ncbi:MAG: PEP-CTERM sorting domain-containing protein [Desulfuromonadales bacterium]|nr:MAG: PEP-CTERM sorting domain-containing protein [Desulfuromonadales bacterium]
MKRNNLLKALATAATVVTLGLAVQADASIIYWDQFAGFRQGSEIPAILDFSAPVTDPKAPASAFADIAWVSGSSPQSQLNIATYDSGVLGENPFNVNGSTSDTKKIATLTQTNRGISTTPTFTVDTPGIFRLYTNVARTLGNQISPPSPDASITNIRFWETPNAPAASPIPPDSPNGPGAGPAGGVNDDRYRLTTAGFGPVLFTFEGQLYELFFDLIPGVGAAAFDSTALGNDPTGQPWDPPPGSRDIWTLEPVGGGIGTSQVDVYATIRPIPEPGTITLLGLGLFGIAVGMRKRRK